MNIFQKKINKQAKLFNEYHNLLWKNQDDISFYDARRFVRHWNKEEIVNTIDKIKYEIKLIKIGIKKFKSEGN